ncbi:copper resistance CopC family protein [Salana multivorans]
MPFRARVLGVLAPLLVLLVWIAAPASAHDTLRTSTPADGAVLDTAPSEVVLEMSATALELGTEIQVLDTAGTNVASGAPEIADRFITVPVGGLAAGEYTVVWRVVSSDGHPIDGTFTFTVAEAQTTTPTAAPGSSSPDASTEPASPTTSSSDAADTTTPSPTDSPSAAQAELSSSGPTVLLVVVIGVAIVLGLVTWLLRRRNAAAARRLPDQPS